MSVLLTYILQTLLSMQGVCNKQSPSLMPCSKACLSEVECVCRSAPPFNDEKMYEVKTFTLNV